MTNNDYYDGKEKVPVRFSDLKEFSKEDNKTLYKYKDNEETDKMKLRPKHGDWNALIKD